jgi:hypothetical protein
MTASSEGQMVLRVNHLHDHFGLAGSRNAVRAIRHLSRKDVGRQADAMG